ncbi:MAG: methyl-accepting chemotaxis protein [Xenococcaceae cyanobacterium MO_167.B52]|nr:methyl-accepting chemotaxis protein [Xenococcaceae cyanobacterium MO_167.B52]
MNNELESIGSELEVDSVTKFQGIHTLRRRLLTTILPVVLLPLVIASTIGYNLIERGARSEIIEELEGDIETDTLLASKTITSFIRESFQIIDLIAANPEVIQSMEAGAKKATEEELTQQSIAKLEDNFASTKLLTTNDYINNYLRQMVKSTRIVEILLTEKNGYNIAFSSESEDFVQRNESWWQATQQEGRVIEELGFNESTNRDLLTLSQAVKNPETDEFIGVIRASIPIQTLNYDLGIYLDGEYEQYYQFQIIDSTNGLILGNIDANTVKIPIQESPEVKIQGVEIVVGGEPILEIARILVNIMENQISLEDGEKSILQKLDFSEFNIREEEIFDDTIIVTVFSIKNKIYSLATIPNTSLVSIGLVDYLVVPTTAQSLVLVFGLTAIVLGMVSISLILLLAKQLAEPLSNLSATTQEMAKGNLELEASLEGTLETHTLADNFNNLIKQIKESLQKQKALTNEQRRAKEQLEKAIYILINEVSAATEGDLTVRASLQSLEMSTVADLFNAIIDSLKEIAIETKQSTSQVGNSLEQNESEIRFLADQATAQAKETRDTLLSIQQMSQSIQEVAENAKQAEQIADDTFNTVLNSSDNIDLTVDSILELRTTVGKTAKKMKRLGESAQKISQVVSFIEEIALKTNVLAINASVEARRAGQYGQGFTIVAEQVGTLAEQSAAATKKIASMVGQIQAETLEVSHAMELGTTQVIESTKRVESTKDSLQIVLEKSQAINHLMESISQTTISQANTSQNVTDLMQKIAQLSEATSISSNKVAQSIVETAEIAEKLELAVAKFKVAQ